MSIMCPQTHEHFKKMHQENRKKPSILKANLRFATETRLDLCQRWRPAAPPAVARDCSALDSPQKPGSPAGF
jgi:hypothetical protein